MWKVPSSNKMAANYFVPPVNFCVCSPKLQNIKKSKQANQPSRKPNSEPSITPHIYFVCLCTTGFFVCLFYLTCNTEKNENKAEN